MRTTCLPWLVLSSCLQVGLPHATDDARPAVPIADAALDEVRTLPPGCVVDPLSRVTLCRETVLCPGLRIDPDVYPDCGFRLPSTTIEVQCVCDDALCPLGTALDCNQLRRLLADQSALLVCIQRDENRCAPRVSRMQ